MTLQSKPKFRGRFFTWEVTISTDHEKGFQEFLLVFSSGKRETVKKYLWHKLVNAELSKEEYLLFILTLGNSEDKKWAFCKALQSVPKRILRKRLNEIERFLQEPETSRMSYIGLRRVKIETHKRVRRLPKFPKYTGYVRSIAALGKGSPGLKLSLEEMMEDDVFEVENQFNWFSALTVGKFLPQQEGVLSPEEDL